MATHSPTVAGKRVSDLRVTELRLELEQRGLETKGLKADLVKRLEKVGRSYLSTVQPAEIFLVAISQQVWLR